MFNRFGKHNNLENSDGNHVWSIMHFIFYVTIDDLDYDNWLLLINVVWEE